MTSPVGLPVVGDLFEQRLEVTRDWLLIKDAAVSGLLAQIALELEGITRDRLDHPDQPAYVAAREERLVALREALDRARAWNPLAPGAIPKR